MQTFKDRNGREWRIEISVTDAGRLIGAGIDGYEIAADLVPTEKGDSGRKANDLVRNVPLVLAALWLLCRDDAKAHSVHDEEAFGKLFKGAQYEDASLALVKEIIDFFANPAMSRAMLRILDKVTPAIATERAAAEAAIAKAVDDLDIGQLLANSKVSPGNSAASPERTPGA